MRSKLTLKTICASALVMFFTAGISFADTNPISTLQIVGNNSAGSVIKLRFSSSGLENLPGSLSTKIIFSNAGPSDIKSMQFVGTDTKTNIVLAQEGSDATALLNYVYADMNFETIFHKSGNYLVSLNVINGVGAVVTSATLPLSINPSQVLGINTAVFKRTLRFGNIGNDVRVLQQILKDRGYFNYPKTTGYFGAVTKASLSAFQNANALASTGILDSATKQALGY